MIKLQTGSVLDLPIERQRELAAEEGKTLEVWRQETREWLDMMNKASEEFTARAKGKNISPEIREHFLDKMASATHERHSN